MKNLRIITLFILCASIITPQAVLALTKKVDVGGKTHTVIDPREYPIIFVPGAAGSNLEAGGYNAWPGALSLRDGAFKILGLKKNGRSPCCGSRAVTTGVMRYGAGDVYMGLGDWQFSSIYQGFYDYMDKAGYGYAVPKEDGKVFYDFPYDWRQDNNRWTKLLDKKVKQVLKATGAEKVILVGHSMGGIQIRLYLADPKRAEKVGGVVFIGTPHHGAPQVFWAYTYGYNFGNSKVSDTTMWEIMKNWPAGYQLLPDYGAVQAEDGVFWSTDKMYGEDFVSKQEYDHYIIAKNNRGNYKVTYGLPNKKFVSERMSFAEKLGDAVPAYDWIDYYMIAGTGQDTVQYFEAKFTDITGLDKPLLKLKKVITKNGDGTVPKAGAKIDGVVEHIEVVGEHSKLPSVPEVHIHLNRMRDSFNNEEARKALLEKQRVYGKSELSRVAGWKADGVSGGGQSIGKIVFNYARSKGAKRDEQKIKLRDKLRSYAVETFENATVNVVIRGAGNTAEDSYYFVIEDFAIKKSGKGQIDKSDVTVRVETKEVLEGILDNNIDEQEAFMSEQLKISGGGVVKTMVGKIYKWISKYSKIKLSQ